MKAISKFITNCFLLLLLPSAAYAAFLEDVHTLVGLANNKRCADMRILSEEQANYVESETKAGRLDRTLFRYAFDSCLTFDQATKIAAEEVNKPIKPEVFADALWRKGSVCGRKEGLSLAQARTIAREDALGFLSSYDFFHAYDRCLDYEDAYRVARRIRSGNYDRKVFEQALWFRSRPTCAIGRVITLDGAELLAQEAAKGNLFRDQFFYEFENCGSFEKSFRTPLLLGMSEKVRESFYRLLWRKNGSDCKSPKSISYKSAEKIARKILEKNLEESMIAMNFENCLSVEESISLAEKSVGQKRKNR